MDEVSSLTLWLNTLNLPSTNDVHTLKDVTSQVFREVIALLLCEDKVDQTEDLQKCFQRLDNVFDLGDQRVTPILNNAPGGKLDNDKKKIILHTLRTIYRAGLRQTPERVEVGKNRILTERSQNINLETSIPAVKPIQPVIRPTSSKTAPQKHFQLAQRILQLVPTGNFFAYKLSSLSRASLMDGLLLCRLVLVFEQKMGMPPRRGCVERKIGDEMLLFFAGVEISPKSRASRLKNIETALIALREWKRFSPRHLWSGNSIADASTNDGIEILSEMVEFVERSVARKMLFQQTIMNQKSNECANDEDWEYGSSPKSPTDISSMISSPPPPPPFSTPPSNCSKMKKQTDKTPIRRQSWGRLYFNSQSNFLSPPPPPPPPPPPTEADENSPNHDRLALVQLKKQGSQRFHVQTSNETSASTVLNFKQVISSPSNCNVIPPLLGNKLDTLHINPNNQGEILSFLQRAQPITLSSREKHYTRVWLFRLGFNILRTSMQTYRTVPPDLAATKDFWGYEGGPFLGDPFRNGKILFELAGLLQRSLDGVISPAPKLKEDEKSFPTAKHRVEYALAELQTLACSCGLGKATGFLFGESAQVHVLSGGPETWTILHALSLAFPVNADSMEADCWERLRDLGLIKYQDNSMNEADCEKISNGELLRNLSLLIQGKGQNKLAQYSAKTRKTAMSNLEKALDDLNLNIPDVSRSIVVRRIHDGDFRLFFQVIQHIMLQYSDRIKASFRIDNSAPEQYHPQARNHIENINEDLRVSRLPRQILWSPSPSFNSSIYQKDRRLLLDGS